MRHMLLVLVQMLHCIVVQLVTSSMFFIVVMVVNVSTSLVLSHHLMVHFVLMGMLMTSRMNMSVTVFHGLLLISCGGFCHRASLH